MRRFTRAILNAPRLSAFAVARLVADELRGYGINMNCAPVLDVPVPGAHDIIGDRAYGATPAQIIDIARDVAEGLMAGGVVPVIKHIPGHGRATADSHLDLPVVTTRYDELSKTDFVPFKALAHMPAAMTAHVVFSDIDAVHPASTSAKVTRDIIRGDIGFDGLLMSDDLEYEGADGRDAGARRSRYCRRLRRRASLQWRHDRDAGCSRRRAAAAGCRKSPIRTCFRGDTAVSKGMIRSRRKRLLAALMGQRLAHSLNQCSVAGNM